MHYTISNSMLSLTVDSRGAQMLSLKTADGVEYLWQGDPAYWKDRAPMRRMFALSPGLPCLPGRIL